MACTVKPLAKLSSVSVRTLHYYDEIALLLPAYVGENGYRYYKEEQLLILQQILFFRELGFELKTIKSIISNPNFDRENALLMHRKALLERAEQSAELVATIDRTLQRLRGEIIMNDKEIYRGFSEEQQREHEQYLINRYGEKAKKHIEQAQKNTKDWSKADWDNAFSIWDDVCRELKEFMDAGVEPKSLKVQAVIAKHYEGIKLFWTPDRVSYIGLTSGFLGLEWKEAFQKYDDQHPRLAHYLASAAEVYANNNLH